MTRVYLLGEKCIFVNEWICMDVKIDGRHVTSALSLLQADLPKTKAGEQTEEAAQ